MFKFDPMLKLWHFTGVHHNMKSQLQYLFNYFSMNGYRGGCVEGQKANRRLKVYL